MEEGDNVVLRGSPLESSAKYRMRWTSELHRLFEEAVNQLGGPDRATPKGIFKAMSVPGLTIAHVKSHLQKYRMSNFVLESSDRGKLESRSLSEILPNFCAASRFQLTEALKLHMEVHRKSLDQLEAQRCLKIRIELQGRYLEKIVEEHHDYSSNCRTDWPLPTALPSVSDLSESHSWNCGSDSEIISKIFHNDAKRKIKPRRPMSHTGLPYDESHGPIGSSITSSVSQAYKRLRVAKDCLMQPTFGASPIKT